MPQGWGTKLTVLQLQQSELDQLGASVDLQWVFVGFVPYAGPLSQPAKPQRFSSGLSSAAFDHVCSCLVQHFSVISLLCLVYYFFICVGSSPVKPCPETMKPERKTTT